MNIYQARYRLHFVVNIKRGEANRRWFATVFGSATVSLLPQLKRPPLLVALCAASGGAERSSPLVPRRRLWVRSCLRFRKRAWLPNRLRIYKDNDPLRVTPNNGKSKNMKNAKIAKNRFLRLSSKLEKTVLEIFEKVGFCMFFVCLRIV